MLGEQFAFKLLLGGVELVGELPEHPPSPPPPPPPTECWYIIESPTETEGIKQNQLDICVISTAINSIEIVAHDFIMSSAFR